ncbi:hypothetical protein F4777DRAFT_435800 [Nemania sp. FL0916]|nr:hypothetical protein F4777DRAFT_435800 [Nemania sp. FL0916]
MKVAAGRLPTDTERIGREQNDLYIYPKAARALRLSYTARKRSSLSRRRRSKRSAERMSCYGRPSIRDLSYARLSLSGFGEIGAGRRRGAGNECRRRSSSGRNRVGPSAPVFVVAVAAAVVAAVVAVGFYRGRVEIRIGCCSADGDSEQMIGIRRWCQTESCCSPRVAHYWNLGSCVGQDQWAEAMARYVCIVCSCGCGQARKSMIDTGVKSS